MIDPDALDARSSSAGRLPRFGQVAFAYVGYDITVSYDGEVVIALDEHPGVEGRSGNVARGERVRDGRR